MSIALAACLLLAAAGLPGEVPITTGSPEALQFFRAGREKALDFKNPEAAALFKKALEQDPQFPQALAWLGKISPGLEGLEQVERALKLAAPLSAPERKTIELILAERKGEDEQARRLKRELADLAPDDWLAQFQLGVQSFYDHKSQAAILYLNKTIQLNPRAAEAYNYLGYVLAQQGQHEEGLQAVKKFVELKPQEPNSYDSLGEVLLIAGRYDQAEEAFARSAQMEKDNWMSWIGVAYARFLRGNWIGGREAAEKSKQRIGRASDRLAVDLTLAWSWLAEGKEGPALQALDAIEKDAQARKNDFGWAWAAFERAEMLEELGHGLEAMKQLEQARARADQGRLSGSEQSRLRRAGLVLQARIGARGESPRDAEQALARLQEELKAAPSNADLRGMVHYAQGLSALAHGDRRAAIASFSRCPETDYRCRLDLVLAQARAGDAGAADESRGKLLRANVRDNIHRGEDPAYLYVSARLKAAGPLAGR
jgi:tetratricopeptide (TPR) repeat protein